MSRYITEDGLDHMKRIEWIKTFSSGKKWLASIPSEQSKRMYASYFKRYCDAVKKTPDELIQLKLEGLKHVGELSEFQAEDLLEEFLENADLPRNAKRNFRTTVMSFYTANRRSLERTTAKKFRPSEPKKRRPTLEDIEKLEACMNTQRDKAILWFLASAPCRADTLTKLIWRDLQPTNDKDVPIRLVIESARLKGKGEGKYEGLKQICFLHYYAVEKLESYKRELAHRGYKVAEDSPIFISYKRPNGESINGERTIHALTPNTLNGIFDDASLCAFGDLTKKRFSMHDFRSFVDTMLMKARVVEEWRAPILAHKVKGIEKHYSEPEQSELLEHFKSALAYLIPDHKQTKTYDKLEDFRDTAQQILAFQTEQLNNIETQISLTEAMREIAVSEEQKARISTLIENMKAQREHLKRSLAHKHTLKL